MFLLPPGEGPLLPAPRPSCTRTQEPTYICTHTLTADSSKTRSCSLQARELVVLVCCFHFGAPAPLAQAPHHTAPALANNTGMCVSE